MFLRTLRPLALGLFLTLVGSTSALAALGQLTGVSAAPNPVVKNTAVAITLTKTGADCGFKINYGDGGPSQGPFGFTSSSKVMSHTYTQPGSYTIQAFGKPKGNKPACKGGTKTVQVSVTGGGGGGGKVKTEILMEAPAGAGALEVIKPMVAKLPKLTVAAVVTPAKDRAAFNVTANRKSTLKLRVFGLIPPANKRCDETLPPFKATFALGKKTHWSTHILGLSPGKKYYWEVCAKDELGETAMASGTLKTAVRRVEISFSMLTITDDSDDLSDGDLFFIFEAGGKRTDYYAELGTGDIDFTSKKITLDHASSQLIIRIRGGDNDGPSFLSTGQTIPNSNYEDWGEIKKTVNLSATEAGTTMYKWTAADHGLGFKAQVYVKVWFE